MWIFWVILILLIIYAVKSEFGNSTNDNKDNENPLQILKKRYARGEIDEQEYEPRRKQLEN